MTIANGQRDRYREMTVLSGQVEMENFLRLKVSFFILQQTRVCVWK